jgi:hypothetical protein
VRRIVLAWLVSSLVGLLVPAFAFAVHPTTGQSVVADNVTGEVIHVGGPGSKYDPGSGDLP